MVIVPNANRVEAQAAGKLGIEKSIQSNERNSIERWFNRIAATSTDYNFLKCVIVYQRQMKKVILKIVILILFASLNSCATPSQTASGQYPVWEPETIAVGISDPTLIQGPTNNHFADLGVIVTATFRLHPTVTIHPPGFVPAPTPIPKINPNN